LKKKSTKDVLKELQDKLNKVVIYDNLHSPEVLALSTKLDQLVVGYYLEEKGNQSKTKKKPQMKTDNKT
jgi:hypothetical protein